MPENAKCRKNVYDSLKNAYYSVLVNIYMTEIYVNCGSWNVHCSVSKVEIVSLAFKWLIVLRLTIKTSDKKYAFTSS